MRDDRKSLFIKDILAGRAGLETVLNRIPADAMLRPDLPGEWTVKDLLAHFAFWQRRTIKLFDLLRAGETPEEEDEEGGLDALNRRVYEENVSRELTEVRADEEQAYQLLMEQVEAAEEDELFEPTRFAWTEGRPFMDWLEGNLHGHWNEHLVDLGKFVTPQDRLP